MRVRVFLRQPLFSLSGEAAHVPANALILDGTLGDATALGVSLQVDNWLDERGRSLEGPQRTLIVPASKIDHVWVRE